MFLTIRNELPKNAFAGIQLKQEQFGYKILSAVPLIGLIAVDVIQNSLVKDLEKYNGIPFNASIFKHQLVILEFNKFKILQGAYLGIAALAVAALALTVSVTVGQLFLGLAACAFVLTVSGLYMKKYITHIQAGNQIMLHVWKEKLQRLA